MKYINILGAGVMGQQLASLFVLLGFNVRLYSSKDIAEKKILNYAKVLRRSFRIGTDISGSVACCNAKEIGPGISIDTSAEDLEVKKALYKRLRRRNDDLFITNTSSFNPMEIGGDVVGMHFFNPITIRLVEITECPEKFKVALADLVEVISSVGFEIVSVKQNRGYIGNKILFGEISNVLKLIEKDGYQAADIAAIYSHLYPERNIFSIIDLIGVDVVRVIMKNLAVVDNSFYVGACLDLAIEKNILGKKNRTSILQVLD